MGFLLLVSMVSMNLLVTSMSAKMLEIEYGMHKTFNGNISIVSDCL